MSNKKLEPDSGQNWFGKPFEMVQKDQERFEYFRETYYTLFLIGVPKNS